MQISSLSSPGQTGATTSYASVQRTETYYESLRSVSVEFSSDGDTVTISASESSLYMESLYTAEGLLTEDVSTGAVEETGAADSAALTDSEVKDYLTILKERISYLLQEAARQSEQFRETLLNGSGLYTAGGVSSSSESTTVIQTTDAASITLDTSYFSAENTADRIVDFALAFYTGGDRAEYVAEIRTAIMKGFEEAKAAFGGFLPDVSYQTMNLVNQALDAFIAEGSTVAA